MGPYAGVDYNLNLCPLQGRLQYIYHGQPYARVDFTTLCKSRLYNPIQESTLSPTLDLASGSCAPDVTVCVTHGISRIQ